MRSIQQMPGARDIKSIHSIGARSIPKVQRSSYLELYMLRREMDRLEKEIFAIDKRRTAANRQLISINKRIEKLQKEVYEEQKIKTYRSIPTRPLKTMAINY
jgi:septal ring factor EnvC (AmiA/AmiB activator)